MPVSSFIHSWQVCDHQSSQSIGFGCIESSLPVSDRTWTCLCERMVHRRSSFFSRNSARLLSKEISVSSNGLVDIGRSDGKCSSFIRLRCKVDLSNEDKFDVGWSLTEMEWNRLRSICSLMTYFRRPIHSRGPRFQSPSRTFEEREMQTNWKSLSLSICYWETWITSSGLNIQLFDISQNAPLD